MRAAVHLAEAGTRVIVVDKTDVAAGASGRTGGQVNPMLPFNGPDALRGMLGATHFERLTEASLSSADALFEFINKYQIECEARQHGWLRVCHNKRALTLARQGLTAWNKHGAEMEVVTGDDLYALSGTRAYSAGVVAPRGGAIHPLKLALGMASVARQRGVEIYSDSAVESLEKTGDVWIAQTANGRVMAKQVIVATNGYSDALVPRLASSVIPLTPIQIATEPLPDDVINSILPHGHTISDSRRVIMYARREPGNRIVYGGLGRTERDNTLVGYDWLIKDAVRVFPQLAGVQWSHRWGGRVAITEDHLPHLHEPEPGLLIGLGYNGRGVAMSQLMGQALAERALGTAQSDLTFPVTTIRPMPGRPIKMMGMRTAVWFMRLMDYFETRIR